MEFKKIISFERKGRLSPFALCDPISGIHCDSYLFKSGISLLIEENRSDRAAMKGVNRFLLVAFFLFAVVSSCRSESHAFEPYLEVLLNAYGYNVTVVSNNHTEPGFGVGDGGYTISDSVPTAMLYFQAKSLNSTSGMLKNDKDAQSSMSITIESIKVHASDFLACQPFLLRRTSAPNFPVIISEGVSNSIGLLLNFNCSQVKPTNVTLAISFRANSVAKEAGEAAKVEKLASSKVEKFETTNSEFSKIESDIDQTKIVAIGETGEEIGNFKIGEMMEREERKYSEMATSMEELIPNAVPPTLIRIEFRKETSSHRLGFNMGTFLTVPDVAFDGMVLSDWSPVAHTIQVSAGVLSSPFNIWLGKIGERQVIESITLTTSPSTHCQPYVQGLAANQTLTITNVPTLALVVYNCSTNGTTLIRMDVVLQGGFDMLAVEWTKQSGGFREFFMIGTKPFSSDVVWWGLTLPLWSDFHFTMSHDIEQTTFYFTMNQAGQTQTVGKPYLSLFNGIISPSLSGELYSGGLVTSLFALNLTITYNCKVEGLSPIQISVPLDAYETVSWRWNKKCGTNRKDFAIGTKPFYDDVVSAGAPTWLFSPTIHTAFVFPDRESSTFYLTQLLPSSPPRTKTPSQPSQQTEKIDEKEKVAKSTEQLPNLENSSEILQNSEISENLGSEATSPIVISSISISTSFPSCTPFMVGNATLPGATLPDLDSNVLVLDVWYNCTRPGSTNVSITIVLEGPYAPITFSWLKRVGKGRNALRIGTNKYWDDVVSQGVPTPLYDPSTFSAFYATNRLYADFWAMMTHEYSTQRIISAKVSSSFMWCYPTITSSWGNNSTKTPPSAPPSTPFEPPTGEEEIEIPETELNFYENSKEFNPNLKKFKPNSLNFKSSDKNNDISTVSNPSNSNQQRRESTTGVALEYIYYGSSANGGMLTYEPHHFRVSWNCLVGGSHVINVTFELEDWGPLTVSMKVYSGGSRPYLDIGTIRGASDVVQGGLPTPLWIPPPLGGAVVSGNVLWTTFWLGMSKINETQLMSYPVPTFQTSDRIISPTISGTFANGGFITNRFDSTVNITYNCSALGSVAISIGFLLPPYDTITFSWTKICSAQRIGLRVGTIFKNADVLDNGLPSMAWDPLSHVAFVTNTQMMSTFFIGMSPKSQISPNIPHTPNYNDPGDQLITKVIVNSSSPICSPYINSSIEEGTILLPDQFLPFVVIYNCSDIGETNIQVTLQLTGNFLPATWMWTKRSGGFFSGLSVGTSPPPSLANNIEEGHISTTFDSDSSTSRSEEEPKNKKEILKSNLFATSETKDTKNDLHQITSRKSSDTQSFGIERRMEMASSDNVIYQGYATFAYDPISHTHVCTTSEETYWTTIGALQSPMKSVRTLPVFSATFSPWLLPSVLGPMSGSTIFESGNTSSFTIKPHCLLATPALQTDLYSLYAFVTPVPYAPSTFAFGVKCPPNIDGLTVTFGNEQSLVVVDGVPTRSWSPANASRIKIEADFNILRFYVHAKEPIDLESILIAEDGVIIVEPFFFEDSHVKANDMESEKAENFLDRQYLHSKELLRNAINDLRSKGDNQHFKISYPTFFSESTEENVEKFEKFEKSEKTFFEANMSDRRSRKSILRYPDVPSPACRAQLSGDLWQKRQIDIEPRLLQLELNCSIGGTNNVSVILVPKQKQSSGTVWTFSKTMGGFRHGFDVSVSAAYAPSPKGNTSPSFTSSTPLTVMEDGEALQEWKSQNLRSSSPLTALSNQQDLKHDIKSIDNANTFERGEVQSPGAAPQFSPISAPPTARQLHSSAATSFLLELSHINFGRDPSQEFFAPIINTSLPCAPVLLGNASTGGYLQNDVPRMLDVISNCHNASAEGEIGTFEIFVQIPPFTPATWSWSRKSTGLPTYLNVDAYLSAKMQNPVRVISGGENAAKATPWMLDSSFSLKFSLDTKQFEGLGIVKSASGSAGAKIWPKILIDATTLWLKQVPIVNISKNSRCEVYLSGNATDVRGGERRLEIGGKNLILNLETKNCTDQNAEFTITFSAYPFTTPMVIKIAKAPPTPQKSKVSGALLGIIIGSTLLIIAAISVGLYLCLRKPTTAPSTGAYHLQRRKIEREKGKNAISQNTANDTEDDDPRAALLQRNANHMDAIN